MRSSLCNVLLILLLAGTGGVHAQAMEPIPEPDRSLHRLPPPHKEAAPECVEPPLDAPVDPVNFPGPRVRIRLRPVRLSLQDIVDRITIGDVLDALSRL